MTQQKLITLYGNLGGDPEVKTTQSKDVSREVYDPIVDDLVEKNFTQPGKEYRTFSLAVSKKDESGQPITRWIRCVDWKAASELLHKGDRVAVKGHFRTRTYEKNGEQKIARDFVVESARIERLKIREQVA